MKITIVTIGVPQLRFAKDGIAEYIKRLGRFADVDLIHLKESKKNNDQIIKICQKKTVILLDETGKEFTTEMLSSFLEKKKNQSEHLCFLIGGPNGHTDEVRSLSSQKIALSQLTFPHDIAMMLLTETLYRSLSILAGHPYHRS